MTAESQMCFVGPMDPPWHDHTHQPQWKALRAVRNPPLIQRVKKDQSATDAVTELVYSSPPKDTSCQWMSMHGLSTSTALLSEAEVLLARPCLGYSKAEHPPLVSDLPSLHKHLAQEEHAGRF